MKDHTYYALIGIPLDKIQEGDFEYEESTGMTIGEYAVKVRKEVDEMSKFYKSKNYDKKAS